MTFIQGESINSGDMYSPVIITKYTINHKNCKSEKNKCLLHIVGYDKIKQWLSEYFYISFEK